MSPACFEAFAPGRELAPTTVRKRVVRLGRQSCLGRVNTNEHGHGILHGWNSPKLNTNESRHICRCSAAMSAFPTAKCSTPSCMSPSMAANGEGYRHVLATGTPSTPG